MEVRVYNFIIRAFEGATTLFDRLVAGVPGMKTAIIWAVLVMLVTCFLIVPLRGGGLSFSFSDKNYGSDEKNRHNREVREKKREEKRAAERVAHRDAQLRRKGR